jgi:hypothetical protein
MSSHINPDSGNLVIESTSDINLSNVTSAVVAALHVNGGQYIANNLYVGGDLLVNSDVITLGDGTGNLTLNTNINSHVLPNTDNGIQYNLGKTSNPWNITYTQKVVITPTSATTTIPTSVGIVELDTTSTTASLVLANGVPGERKAFVVTATLASNVTITPTTALFTSIEFSTPGNTAELVYTTSGWAILSTYGSSVV